MPFIRRHHRDHGSGLATIGAAGLDNFQDLPEMPMLHFTFELFE
jgi:hypothetical protein